MSASAAPRGAPTRGAAARCTAIAFLAGALALGVATRAHPQPVAAWRTDDIRVARSAPGHEATANTRFEVAENGDARITSTSGDGGTQSGGTILVIAGRWVLSRGYAPSRRAIEVLDAATLDSQLVILLLNAALPHGPPKPGEETPVSTSERNKPIRIATPSASAVYSAPWSVTGTVTVREFGAPAAFRLTFTFFDDTGRSAARLLTGTIGAASTPLSLPDSMRLAGWTIRRIDAGEPASAGAAGSTAPPSAKAAAKPAEVLPIAHPKATTLGELRRE